MKTNSCYGILTLTMVVVLSACQADKAETHAEDGLNQDKTKQRQADPSQVNPVKDNIKNENPVNDKQKIQVSKRSENATTAQLKEANDILEDIMKTLQATEKVVKDESLRAGLSPIRANMKFIKDELSRAGLTIIDLRLALNRYYQICMGTKPVLDRLRNQAETDIQARALYTRINRLFEYAYKLETSSDFADDLDDENRMGVLNLPRDFDRKNGIIKNKRFSMRNLGEALESVDKDVIPSLSQCSKVTLTDAQLRSLQEQTTEAKRSWNSLNENEINHFRSLFRKVMDSLIQIDKSAIEDMVKNEDCKELGQVLGDFVQDLKTDYLLFYRFDEAEAATKVLNSKK